jgi:segregation and condensation protein B
MNEENKYNLSGGIDNNLKLIGPGWIKTCIEGILFISEDPVKLKTISETLGIKELKAKEIIDEIDREYIEQNRGFIIKKISGGYRMYSNPALQDLLKKFIKTNIRPRLSQAAIETLAIAAYRQPITRTEIAEIRGVRTDSVIVALVEKGLLKESGKLKEPGNPIIYRTTDKFLEAVGINSLDDLPPIEDFKEDEELSGD